MSLYDIDCALSGITPRDEELFPPLNLDPGELKSPLGWVEVTLTRRYVNPKYLMILQAQQAMLESMLSQLPPDQVEGMQMILALQVESTFAALLKDTPKIMDVKEVAYISNPDENAEIMKQINELRDLLALVEYEEMAEDDSADDEDADDDEAEAETA
jgi:hypothetical protein